MSDYLTDILARSFNPATGLRPQVPSVFEPQPEGAMHPGPLHLEPPAEMTASPLSPSDEAGMKLGPPKESYSTADGPLLVVPERPLRFRASDRREPYDVSPSPVSSGQALQTPSVAEPPHGPLGTTQPKPIERQPPVIPTIHAPTSFVPPAVEDDRSKFTLPIAATERLAPPVPPRLTPAIEVQKEIQEIYVRQAERLLATTEPSTARRPSAPVRPGAVSIQPITKIVHEFLPKPQPTVEPPQPTIHVTIGRLEVRAVAPSARHRAPPVGAKVLSLDDYLHQRVKGDRR